MEFQSLMKLYQEVGENKLYCKICKETVEGRSHQELAVFHYYNEKHGLNTIKLLDASGLLTQSNITQDGFSLKDNQLFDYKEAVIQLSISKKNLKQYLSQCAENLNQFFNEYTAETIRTYMQTLKDFLMYMFKNQLESLTKEIILKYIQEKATSQASSVGCKLIKKAGYKLNDNEKKILSTTNQLRKELQEKSLNQINIYFNLLVDDLCAHSKINEAIVCLFSQSQIKFKTIKQLTFREIMEKSYSHFSNCEELESSTTDKILGLIQQIIDKDNSYLNDKIITKNITRNQFDEDLKVVIAKIIASSKDAQYQMYLQKFSLKMLLKQNHKISQQEDKIQIQNQELDQIQNKNIATSDGGVSKLAFQNDSLLCFSNYESDHHNNMSHLSVDGVIFNSKIQNQQDQDDKLFSMSDCLASHEFIKQNSFNQQNCFNPEAVQLQIDPAMSKSNLQNFIGNSSKRYWQKSFQSLIIKKITKQKLLQAPPHQQ